MCEIKFLTGHLTRFTNIATPLLLSNYFITIVLPVSYLELYFYFYFY